MINTEVIKAGNENSLNLIRRFTKRVQGSGVLPRVRSIRYATRKPSSYVKKKKTLNNKLIAKKTMRVFPVLKTDVFFLN